MTNDEGTLAAASPADVQATFCTTLVDEWVHAGVVDAVVSPGSRSTPLAMALVADGRIAVHVHHDERSAAFVALGLGLAAAHPAIVLTTSGTAAVELHPAIVEAHQAGVPLIAVTADRPPELHHVGAPQTVDQDRLFGEAVRWFAAPGVADAASASTWRSLAARSVAEATTGTAGPGPVHLNLAFREPLVGTPGPLPPARPQGTRWHTTVGRQSTLDRSGTDRLLSLLDRRRVVIVAGAGAGDPDSIAELAATTGWPVLADAPSGSRLPRPGVVGAFDPILRHAATAERLRPDAVLHLGAPPASKVLGQWLAGSGAARVAIDLHGRWFDPDHQLDHVVHADPTWVVQTLRVLLSGRGEPDQTWVRAWTEAERAAQGALGAELSAIDEPTEPGTARSVVAAIQTGSTLVVSSSMPIRDVEWFAAPHPDLRVLANRGANGIDGVVSTAVGVALAGKRVGSSTVVLIGDVAFLHDTNALLGLSARDVDLTIVVVDNDGGGIFSFLPQAEALDHAAFELLFGTPHGVDLSMVAAAHGLVTIEPAGAADVMTAVSASIGAKGTRVVRVPTDRQANTAVHDRLNAAVAAALERR